jgi:hypothetical protein
MLRRAPIDPERAQPADPLVAEGEPPGGGPALLRGRAARGPIADRAGASGRWPNRLTVDAEGARGRCYV